MAGPSFSGQDPLKIAALWTATLLIFAYVDLFSLYRSDVRADLDAGRLFAFDVSQTFLFFTTLYIVLPSLMIYLTLVLSRGISRVLNIALAAVYASPSWEARLARGATFSWVARLRPCFSAPWSTTHGPGASRLVALHPSGRGSDLIRTAVEPQPSHGCRGPLGLARVRRQGEPTPSTAMADARVDTLSDRTVREDRRFARRAAPDGPAQGRGL
jgi:hypothetical protein